MPRQISVDELARVLAAAEPVFLVDVREPWERETAALPGGILIPLQELDDRWPEAQAPAGALMVTYCHHGVRSLSAAAFLEARGLGPVVSLAGGIDAWSRLIDSTILRY